MNDHATHRGVGQNAAANDAAGPAVRRPAVRDLVMLVRPHQWVKNVLLFMPLLLAHRLNDWHRWRDVMTAFLAFCLAASSVYVLNDLLDVEADRRHDRKRDRPFAARRVPPAAGPPLVLVLIAGAAGLCLLLPFQFFVVLAFYLLLSTAYSLFLKSRLLVDIMVLAGLYTLRIIAGGAAAGVAVSRWMDAFSMFLFVSLAFAKRYTELAAVEGRGESRAAGRSYEVQDLRIIEAVGPASGYMAVLVLALYLSDPTPGAAAVRLYTAPVFLWLLCPLLLYWVTRIWFIARRRMLHHDPIVFAIKDRVSWCCLVVAGALVVLASLPVRWPGGLFTGGQ